MRCVKLGLTGNEYWTLVGSVWTDSENIRQSLSFWKRLWSSDAPGRHFAMNREERVRFAEMPETISVWRGTSFKSSINGLAWTFDVEKAEWFARRFHRRKSFIVWGQVEKDDVCAVFLRRNESEVVSARVRVETLTEIP
jgi:hypothetical protein